MPPLGLGRPPAAHIRLDENADALVSPAALEAFMQATALYADPTAAHAAGAAARRALDAAHERIATLLGVTREQVLLTSGGTESDALIVLGAASAAGERPHVVTSTIEHAAMSATLAQLEEAGRLRVTRVPVGRDGLLRSADVLAALERETRLVTVVAACNETGVVQPLDELGPALRARGIPLHSDAVQLFGRTALRTVAETGADSVSLSGHKLGAVGGVGVLVVTPGQRAAPLFAQDNLAGACSLAAALETLPAAAELEAMAARRDQLERGLCERLPHVEVLGASQARLANTSSIRFVGCEGDAIMMALDLEGVAVSTGSACSSGSIEPSPILMGMRLTATEARQVVRFSASRATTSAQIAQVIAVTTRVVERIRAFG